MDLDLDMDTGILNIKYKMYNDGYMYWATPKQHLKLNSLKSK